MRRIALRRLLPLALLISLFALRPARAASLHWLRANFHAHSARAELDDDGTEPPEALHRALRDRGFDFSLHTPHSTVNVGADSAARFAAEREFESRLTIPGLTIAVGEELTVAEGPSFERRTRVLGHEAPGNLNHLTVLGMKGIIPSRTALVTACDRVHREGGVCIVNHPGPGPMMWEEGLWEAPENRGKIDALEVYNGQALSAIGLDFEGRYLEATAYSGLALKIAATTGADTHGPQSVARARSKLAGFGAAARLLKFLIAPGSATPRPELEAATLVQTDAADEGSVIAAIKSRRTVATYALPRVELTCPGIGEVRTGGDVALRCAFGRSLAEVSLYREGAVVKSWRNVAEVSWTEVVTEPTAYVWGARDGAGRLLTSAIWYEPARPGANYKP